MKKAIRTISLMLVFGMLLSLSALAGECYCKRCGKLLATNKAKDFKFGKRTTDVISGYRHYQGIVFNKGPKAMQYVKIKIFFYDRRGKLLRIEDTYTDPTTIKPYGKGTYTFMIESSFRYKTYKIEADWSY